MHLGHARTFWAAQLRAELVRHAPPLPPTPSTGVAAPVQAAASLIFRNEDLDGERSRPDFMAAQLEDLAWFGLRWQEGPDIGRLCQEQLSRQGWVADTGYPTSSQVGPLGHTTRASDSLSTGMCC
jgi:hypothetical protein